MSGDVEERFDTSKLPSSHPSGIPTGRNKKVLGKFKDELGGKIMTETKFKKIDYEDLDW